MLTKRAFLGATLAAAASGGARADAWPSKSIRMIVPLAPGSTADIVARIFADELGKSVGQTVVVDNKTGAGGTIATAEAARAPADGYTFALVSQGTMVFNMGLYKTPGYDSLKDLKPVAVSGGVSNVLIVHPDNPAKTVADLLAQARAKPGELTYSSGGVGTSHHMSGVLLEMRTGVKLQHVPYRATPAGIQGVANGEVVMGMFNTPTVIGLIKGGKLKPLAVTSATRSELLPDVPTMMEAGVKDYVVNTWMGFAVPAGVPAPVLDKFNAELNRIAAQPPVREKMKAQGIDMLPPLTPAAAEKLVSDDLTLWLPIIKTSGASSDK
ncbi:Bug family tripartite tricarboxylate transporter substrate binding protein [Reyranella sp.]|uniref:Bug family tripartite tricarboxylate transporter substrate binding protein n=1 Tax=Reyranella sp. TaxID=1929291 RepID=UPI003BA918CD